MNSRIQSNDELCFFRRTPWFALRSTITQSTTGNEKQIQLLIPSKSPANQTQGGERMPDPPDRIEPCPHSTVIHVCANCKQKEEIKINAFARRHNHPRLPLELPKTENELTHMLSKPLESSNVMTSVPVTARITIAVRFMDNIGDL